MRSLRQQIIRQQAIQWLLLLVVGAVIFFGIQQRADAVSRENAARAQLAQLQTVLTDVTDLETGMRGYVLTGNPVFLDPYNTARNRLQSDLDIQGTLIARDPTADSPVQLLQMRNIQNAMQRWYAEVADPEIIARQQDPGAVVNVPRQTLGKSLVDTVRLNIDRYRSTETAILNRRTVDADNALQLWRLVSLLGLALAIVTSAIVGLLIARRLTVAVARLVVGAERLAGGALDERIEEGGSGGSREFALLARAFNRMAVALGASRDDLNTRNIALTAQATALEQTSVVERSLIDMLRLFTTSYDRSTIFRNLLTLLAERHGFIVSVIYAYDEWSGLFTLAASYGTASDLRPQIGLDDGMIGQAVRNRKVVTLHDAPVITVDTGLVRGPARLTTIAPVYYQDRIMAVLVLARQSDPEPLVLTFLDRLVQQLGIAMQNLDQYTSLQSLSEQLQARGTEIEVKNRHLERADRLKSEFLANMSHELRTPLNAILGFSELLLEQFYGPVNGEQSEYLRSISSSGEHLLALINDILDLSKIEAGRMELDVEAINVPALLESSIAIVREKAHHADVSITLDVGDTCTLDADPRKVKQILFNLLSNAVKFTPAGGSVTIAARTASRADAGAGVEFIITDTGIGISTADQTKLFREFTQVDGSLSRRHEGTGLGLALTKRLVDLHGGQIDVQSAPGIGSAFTVWLPLVAVDGGVSDRTPGTASMMTRIPVSDEDERAARNGRAVFAASGVVRLRESGLPHENALDRILIVEDDDDTAMLIAAYLDSAGYETARARNGIEALEQARTLRPQGITLDVMMPEMAGWTFLEALAREDILREIPVIVLSVVNDIRQGWSLGASAVLTKPVRGDELYGALAKLNILPHTSSPLHVLVVDDDPKAVQVVSGYLTSLGHEVIEAYGGVRGIELASEEVPDLIILDLMMPEVTGFTVVERLRENPRTHDIPIIILTAKIVTEEERKRLNGYVAMIAQKSSLNRVGFLAEVNRAVRGAQEASVTH